MSWEAVIGLEIHVQLATNSKIFSDCPAGIADQPNENIDPVSTGQPGVLPVLNQKAVELAVKAALAVDCRINQTSIFARKHYFYPDLPKAYQISQYDQPYAEHGHLDIQVGETTKRIGITRIHMEEDAGKSSHGDSGDPHSYVDFNRAGAPLVEIVSEPDLRTAAEAGTYMRALHAIVRCVGASDADMEKGNFRCDANVSVRKVGSTEFGTRTETKNLNSFRFVEKAIDYEIERQISVLENGGQIVQQTRLWDSNKNCTFSMRDKEDAHDYRYFPDPDLPPLVITSEMITQLKQAQPELPDKRQKRFVERLGIKADDAKILVDDMAVADFFETVASACGDPKLAANWIVNEEVGTLDATRFSELICLLKEDTISAKIAKELLISLQSSDKTPRQLVDEQGLAQISDTGALESAIDNVLANHTDEVARFQQGEQKLMGFFMGQIMKATQGKANPAEVQKLIRQKLV